MHAPRSQRSHAQHIQRRPYQPRSPVWRSFRQAWLVCSDQTASAAPPRCRAAAGLSASVAETCFVWRRRGAARHSDTCCPCSSFRASGRSQQRPVHCVSLQHESWHCRLAAPHASRVLFFRHCLPACLPAARAIVLDIDALRTTFLPPWTLQLRQPPRSVVHPTPNAHGSGGCSDGASLRRFRLDCSCCIWGGRSREAEAAAIGASTARCAGGDPGTSARPCRQGPFISQSTHRMLPFLNP